MNIDKEKEDNKLTNIILKCLEYSNESYEKNTSTKLVHKSFKNNIFNDVELYYERDEENLFIAIRGTATIYDCINDINCIQERISIEECNEKDINVHKGFNEDFKCIKVFLKELVGESVLMGIKNVYFTGHSRGSSICSLSSIYIKIIYKELNIYNIGFGCPRLGNKDFTVFYNNLMSEKTYLFREEYDIITRIPIYGYYDIMNQYVIKNNKIYSKYEPNNNIIKFIESGIESHKLTNYMKCDYIFEEK